MSYSAFRQWLATKHPTVVLTNNQLELAEIYLDGIKNVQLRKVQQTGKATFFDLLQEFDVDIND